MKKQNLFPLLVALVVLLAAGSGYAQNRVMANVPFDFNIGDRLFTAGHYEVESVSLLGTLAIRGERKQIALITSHAVYAKQANEQAKLVFKRYGASYVLRQVWTPGEAGRELPITSLEKEMAEKYTPELVVVAALQ